MPIYRGLTQNNPTDIFVGETSLGYVYVGDKLVWQKTTPHILGFEAYVEPTGFDRTAQPVDIYEVFEDYYRTNNTAKFIYSVTDTATYTILENMLNLAGGYYTSGNKFRVSYELSGVRHFEEYGSTTLNQTITFGSSVDTITVSDTSEFPDSGTIMIGGSYAAEEYYNWKFTYTSKDSTHFYGTSQTIGGRYNMYTGAVVTLRYTWQGTKRYVIVSHTANEMMMARCAGIRASTPTVEWMYCGNWISTLATSDGAGGLSSSCKYIHVHKLSNITLYGYGCHRGTSTLTGKIYLSPSVTYLTPSNTSSTAYDIYPGAFTGCSGINEHLDIPSSMIVIGGNSFAGTNIPSVSFHENLQEIRRTAFYGCTSLLGTNTSTKTLEIPDSVTHIGNQTFYNCNKITTLDIGSSVNFIGYQAFYSCTSMTNTLTIPASVTSIGYGAFSLTEHNNIVSSSSNFNVTDYVLYDVGTSGQVKALYSAKGYTGNWTYRSDTTELMHYCSINNTRNTTASITIPSTVITIGDYALEGCTGLTGNIVIPDSCTLIGTRSFYNCTGFNGTISLGTGVVTIGQQSFSYCSNITGNLVIPNSTTTVKYYAFYGCNKLTGTLTLGSSVATIERVAFYYPFTGALAIPASLTSLAENVFTSNKATSLTSSSTNYPDSDNVLYDVKTVGQVKATASACAYAGTLTLRADTTSILVNCFYQATTRTGSITIPDTVSSIATYAFCDCTGIDGDLTIPSSVISIGEGAFRNMTNAKKNLIIQTTNFTAGWIPWYLTPIGQISGGVQLPANYSGSYNVWNFSSYLSADTMNTSLANVTDGTSETWKTFTIGTTNKARLLAAYPNAETNANARYIYVV